MRLENIRNIKLRRCLVIILAPVLTLHVLAGMASGLQSWSLSRLELDMLWNDP